MRYIIFSIISICSLNLQAQTDYIIKFKAGARLFNENKTTINLNPKEENTFNSRTYWFIQFYEIPTIEIQQELSRHDIKLLEYIPEKTYIVSLPLHFDKTLLKDFPIRSVQAYSADFKLSPAIRELIELSKLKDTHKIEIVIHSFDDIPIEIISARLKMMKLSILKQYNGLPFLHCIVPLDQITDLSNQGFVSYIDKPTPKGVKEDRGARALHRTSAIDNEFASGLHYDGSGVNVCVRDDGKIGPHIDYKGRFDQSLTYSNLSFSTHGDMVSGILMGGGNLNPDVTGTAKGAFLYLLDYEADFMDETLMLHKDKNVVITNSSYSDGCNDGYTDYTYTIDKQIFENPTLMHVFSAGNSGSTDCGYGAGTDWGNITGGNKLGKNCLAVGNTDELGVLDNSSSRGPATDGRIKPDICAQGSSQLSTFPNNTINFGGGTSAAAPGISGVLAELNQAYREKNNGQAPPSALLKACLLNSANDLATPGPDFITGWGLVNALRAYNILDSKQYLTNSIFQSEQNTSSINIPAGTKRLNVMLYWAEKPAAVMSSKALINDLDLNLKDEIGKLYLPWILDPTPVSDSLSKPATKGIDHLNNMEQVSIDKPVAGKYDININGFSIPTGKQDYWITYEIIADTPRIVYPYGGESFNPKELISIQWDAAGDEGEFTLDYSLNEGQNWTFIKKVNGNLRRTYWQTLANPTEKIWLRISRNGNSNMMQHPYTILQQIDTVHIDRICPDFVELSWDSIPSASKYVIYHLEDKYMETFDIAFTNKVSIPLVNPGIENWYSIQPVWADGTTGKRSVAIKVQDLLNCKQAVDLALSPVNSLDFSGVYCENEKIPLNIKISNNGLSTQFYYVVNVEYSTGKKFSVDFIKPLYPDSMEFVTIDTIDALQSGNFTIKVFVDAIGETAFFNDTLQYNFQLTVQSTTGSKLPVINGFEEAFFPPLKWTVFDHDQDISWDRLNCIGSDGNATKAAWMNNFSNPGIGNLDDLITEKFDLINESKAYLVYDYAYAMYDFTTQDSLIIDVSNDCGSSFPVRILYIGGEDLQTAGVLEDQFVPDNAKQWNRKVIDLSQFLGQSVSFRFRNISGYGNSLCIDNIKVLTEVLPKASILYHDTIGCINGPIELFALLTDTGSYQWSFGADALPVSATGPGPHTVLYNSSGLKEVKLLINAGVLIDSAKTIINIEPNPDAKFSFFPVGKMYQFNTIANYQSWTHFWDFGDGNNSNLENPIHTYISSGNYNVQHEVNGFCGLNKSIQNIFITSVKEYKSEIKIFPNPANNDLFIQSINRLNRIELTDVNDKILKVYNEIQQQYETKIDISDLPAGIYFIKILTDKNRHITKISKI